MKIFLLTDTHFTSKNYVRKLYPLFVVHNWRVSFFFNDNVSLNFLPLKEVSFDQRDVDQV